jgi:hypothetical protein
MKVILPLWNTQSSKLSDAWYCRMPHGGLPSRGLAKEYIISPFSVAGQAYANKILAMVSEAYSSPTVLVISTGMRDGESVMPPDPLYHGVDALMDWRREHKGLPDHQRPETLDWMRAGYTRMLIDRQKALVGDELWFAWHLRKASMSPCYGVQWINDCLAAYQDMSNAIMSPHNINHISYAHWIFDDMPGKVAEFSRTWGTKEWVGAEYCEGLRAGNAQKAKDAGLRGLILGPCHPFTQHTSIEPWMLYEIEKAVKLWD